MVAISVRAIKSRRPDDVKCCIMYHRCLRGRRHEVYNHFSFSVTGSLVHTLALQAELELGDVDEDIEEMADLCHALLDSERSTDFLAKPIMAFARTVLARVEETVDVRIPSEKAIDCLRRAIGCLRRAFIHLPDMHFVSIVLAKSLNNRFSLTVSDDDYNEGMAILDEVISFRGPGNTPSPEWENASKFASKFCFSRFQKSGEPEDLELAIYLMRTLVDGMSLQDPLRDMSIRLHSLLQRMRFASGGSGVIPKLGNLTPSISEHDKLPSFRNLIASLPELNAKQIPNTTFDKHFNALLPSTIDRRADIADIEDGVKYCQELLASYPGHGLAHFAGMAIGHLLHRAFECTNEIEYLNRAISAARDSVQLTCSLDVLISYLFTRFSWVMRREDLDEITQLLPIAAENAPLEVFRLPYLHRWALVARVYGHSSVLTAYDRTMSSMQACLTLAPTLDIKHSQLTTMDGFLKTPLDYASHLIHTSQLKQAIETLEQGRSLLWSEMRGLRTTINQIRLANPHLADNFAAVSRELETVTLAVSPKSNVGSRDSDIDGMDPFGHLVVRQRKLFNDRQMLISQVQALPGFDTFLKPPSFDTLHSAALHGPVIIINHSAWRSDIIILHHNSPPSLINTSHDFYARANELQDQLLGARKEDPESNTYENALRFVLEELYELVGRPVIKRLNELNVPEQSRIWWCPTSVFCSLPLHAMGPIQSDVDPPQYFLDLYIPSYIPSLSALIESRKPGTQTIGKPSILLVAHPDENMPGGLKEMKVVQAVDTEVTTLFSAKATPNAVLSRLRDHRFVHVVSHGILEPGKPFEASFKLHRGKRLLLLDIVRSRLPDAEFAFLSACHTAELAEESIADEVLHLAAAMQFCGFRSVVGTMWAMADVDGRDLARHFYESVFSEEAQDGRYYERTASALRDAVLNLRRKGGITLERWVNFVHYGA